ncbi:MAG TPA: hypothetical protein VFU34_05010, partial [Gaiellaceae bacterium]|nr:hypothetical protein [Gaiellaceae bacterium]
VRTGRLMLALVAAVALAVVGLALASCGGGNEPSGTTTDIYDTTTPPATTQTTETGTTPPVDEIVVRLVVVNGAPQGGIARETVRKGDRVVLVVESDVADEVHLHGYDITRDVAADGTVRVRFVADVPGRFEVELEQRGVQIAELTVEP